MSKKDYRVIDCGNGKFIRVWDRGIVIEEEAFKLSKKISELPFVTGIAMMPDAHSGIGCNIGSVIVMKDAVVPSFTGVDIGCGMIATRTNIDPELAISCKEDLFASISEKVPNGRTSDGGENDVGRWHVAPDEVSEVWKDKLESGYLKVVSQCPSIDRGNKVTWEHLGTLGTGNHFLELCTDQENRVWIMLHSGSRGVGARIGNSYIRIAKEECDRWYIKLPDQHMGYFPRGTQMFSNYLDAVRWAQDYAFRNRQLLLYFMKKAICDVIGNFDCYREVNCHHNYVDADGGMLVTRKGAIDANQNVWGIVPGSMGNKSYIGQGKGERDSYYSCSHGAGRAMSRTKARQSITVDQHKEKTKGVACAKDNSVIDESPGAYKDIDLVIEAEKDLFTPVYTLKQFVCVKGQGDE